MKNRYESPRRCSPAWAGGLSGGLSGGIGNSNITYQTVPNCTKLATFPLSRYQTVPNWQLCALSRYQTGKFTLKLCFQFVVPNWKRGSVPKCTVQKKSMITKIDIMISHRHMTNPHTVPNWQVDLSKVYLIVFSP